MWYICLRSAVRSPGEFKAGLEDHLAWMRSQHECGNVLMSGPSPGRNLGIYIIKAASMEEAARIASDDPFTLAGDARFELIDWDVRQVLGVGPFTSAAIKAQK